MDLCPDESWKDDLGALLFAAGKGLRDPEGDAFLVFEFDLGLFLDWAEVVMYNGVTDLSNGGLREERLVFSAFSVAVGLIF